MSSSQVPSIDTDESTSNQFLPPTCNMCNRKEKSKSYCVYCKYFLCHFCQFSHNVMLCFNSHRVLSLNNIKNIEDLEKLLQETQTTETTGDTQFRESLSLQLWEGKHSMDQLFKLMLDLSEAFEILERDRVNLLSTNNLHQQFQRGVKKYRDHMVSLLDKECYYIRNGFEPEYNSLAVKNLLETLTNLKERLTKSEELQKVMNFISSSLSTSSQWNLEIFNGQVATMHNSDGAHNVIGNGRVKPKNVLPNDSFNIPPIDPEPSNSNFVTPTPSLTNSSESGCILSNTNHVKTMHIYKIFGQKGNASTYFNAPHGFCLGLNEDIVVADSSNHRIQIFDKTGIFKSQFGITGRHDGYLWYPRKVAFLPTQKRYVVCDRGYERSRMQIFTESGKFVKKIYIQYIDIVAGIAITDKEDIVVVNSVTPTVFIIGQNDFLRSIDCSSFMEEPSDITVCGKEFYICDFKAHRVVVIDEDGNLLRKFGNKYTTMFPNGIDILLSKYVLIGDSHGNFFHIVVYLKDGTYIGEYRCPYIRVSRCCGLKITHEGLIITVDKNYHHVIMLEALMITE